jgi:hypothetical protein
MKAKDCLLLLDRKLENTNATAPFLKDENSENYGKLPESEGRITFADLIYLIGAWNAEQGKKG